MNFNTTSSPEAPKTASEVTPETASEYMRRRVWERIEGSSLVLALVVLVVYGLGVQFQEKILVGNGFGYDGFRFGAWAQDFPTNVLKSGVNDYYTQRVLPSAAVYSGLALLHIDRTVRNTIHGFEMANAMLVFLSALSFSVSSKRIGLSLSSRWLGAVCLFGSFGILKWSAYDPVLTDVWAFALGTFQLQFYLSRNIIALALVSMLGAFAWPTLIVVGACLLFFYGVEQHAPKTRRPAPAHLHDVAAAVLTGGWVYACISLLKRPYEPGILTGPISLPLVRLSVLASAAFLFWGARAVLDDRRLFDPRCYLRGLWSIPALLAPAIVVVTGLVRTHRLSNGVMSLTLQDHLDFTVFTAIKQPGAFAVAHVVFFGPIFLVVCLRCRHWARIVQRHGMGLTFVAVLALISALNTESRKLFNFVPMLVPFALKVLDELETPRRRLMQFALVSLFFSKTWFTIDSSFSSELTEFPAQTLFMSTGPWMNLTMYAVQGAAVALAAYWMASWLPRPAEQLEHRTG